MNRELGPFKKREENGAEKDDYSAERNRATKKKENLPETYIAYTQPDVSGNEGNFTDNIRHEQLQLLRCSSPSPFLSQIASPIYPECLGHHNAMLAFLKSAANTAPTTHRRGIFSRSNTGGRQSVSGQKRRKRKDMKAGNHTPFLLTLVSCRSSRRSRSAV